MNLPSRVLFQVGTNSCTAELWGALRLDDRQSRSLFGGGLAKTFGSLASFLAFSFLGSLHSSGCFRESCGCAGRCADWSRVRYRAGIDHSLLSFEAAKESPRTEKTTQGAGKFAACDANHGTPALRFRDASSTNGLAVPAGLRGPHAHSYLKWFQALGMAGK